MSDPMGGSCRHVLGVGIATLDVISAGRVTLGVGVGARPEDYRAVGAPFDGPKLRRMEEQVAESAYDCRALTCLALCTSHHSMLEDLIRQAVSINLSEVDRGGTLNRRVQID